MQIPFMRTIVLPIDEKEYTPIVDNKEVYRKKLDTLIEVYPELFPEQITHGYYFIGYAKNRMKSSIARRIIRIKTPFNSYNDYLLHPCFIMPYLKGITKEVSDGLLLRKYNTPYHVIARILGKNPMYWYRAEVALSQYNIVGTTIKTVFGLPYNLLIDEHHSRLSKDKVYICTTVGNNCFLGVGISPTMLYDDLKIAYGQFKKEVQLICPNYSPTSINIDGYKSTKKTAKWLYPSAGILRCFLHSFLKIRNCGTKAYDLYFNQVAQRVWNCYESPDKRTFSLRICGLEKWTQQIIPTSSFKKSILQLCKKKRIFDSL